MVFCPLGASGSMKLSDFLINEKVPLTDKPKIITLSTLNEVIWVCGIRISDKFKISEATQRYLEGQVLPKGK